MQTLIYTPEQEQQLMSYLWSPQIKDDLYRFVMYTFPWGKKGTPLEHFHGPRKWQRKVLDNITEHIHNNKGKIDFETYRHAIASGRGIGKSALVAWITIWFITTRIGSTTTISANSESQLRSVTWAEITKWLAMAINSHWFEIAATKITPAKWLTELVEDDLKMGTRYWAVEGKLWSEENPDAYAGTHNHAGMLLIFDEASGIADNIWSVAAGFFTENTPHRFWLAFSNPRRNLGYFYECFNARRAFWKTTVVDARTVEGTDKAVYQQIIDEYGPDSREAHVEVYGEFPAQSDEQFISRKLVDEAIARPPLRDPSAPIIIGVDPARSGADATVIVVRQGRDIVGIQSYRGEDTMTVVGYVIQAIEQYRPLMTVIDEGGVGGGVVDRLKEQRYKVRGVNFGAKSTNQMMYGNKRSQMWGDMREWLRTATIPDNRYLKADLLAPTQYPDSKGAIFLESKKDMKARGLPSPDYGDALACTFAFKIAALDSARVDNNISSRYSANNASNFTSTTWLGH